MIVAIRICALLGIWFLWNTTAGIRADEPTKNPPLQAVPLQPPGTAQITEARQLLYMNTVLQQQNVELQRRLVQATICSELGFKTDCIIDTQTGIATGQHAVSSKDK